MPLFSPYSAHCVYIGKYNMDGQGKGRHEVPLYTCTLNGKLVKKYGVPRGSLLRPKRYEAGF